MFDLQGLQEQAKKFVADNATVLLTAGGVVGTVATGVLAWRGGYKYAEVLRSAKVEKISQSGESADPNVVIDEERWNNITHLDTTTKIKLGALQALPPIIIGGSTIAAIIFSHRMSAQKAAAMAALYGVSQKQLEDYKAKIEEKLTGPKNQAIKDEIAQDRVNEKPPTSQILVVEGKVLCFDAPTGRYFQSSMEDIKKAVNTVNAEILMKDGSSASRFYEELGLPPTTWTDDVGWDSMTQVDLDYSSVIAYNDQPCISIDFKVLPKADWSRTY